MEISRAEEILMKVALTSFWFIIIFTFTGLAILLVYKGEIALIIIICGMVALIIYGGFKLIWRYKRPTIGINVQGGPSSVQQDANGTASPNRRTPEYYHLNNCSNQTPRSNNFNSGLRPEILLQPHLLHRNGFPEPPPPDYYSIMNGRSENIPSHVVIVEEKVDDSLPTYHEALCLK